MKKLIVVYVLFAVLGVHKLSAQNASLEIRVIAPPGTPKVDTLLLVGNQRQWGDWFYPNGQKLTKANDSTWVYKGSFPVSTPLSFKITRGSYYSEALYGGSTAFPPNNSFTLYRDTLITLRPYTWNDLLNRSITGTVKYHHNFDDPNLRFTRDVIVWLPPSYYKSPQKRYPVLYAHDGQNLFDASTAYGGQEWHMDEIADKLMRSKKVEEFIIVGIANTKDRWAEYSGTEEGKNYVDFIAKRLKPFIDGHYRTKKDRKNTAALGSSMGGLISFYMAWWYPNIFSKVACLSSGFAYDSGNITYAVSKSTQRLSGTNIYLDCGDQALDKYFLPKNRIVASSLIQNKHVNAVFRIFPGASHNEQAWADRLSIPLTFLFGEQNKSDH